MEFKSIQYCDKMMKELAVKMRTYKKKRERWSLTDEEAQSQRKALIEFNLLHSELIDSRLEDIFFPLFYTTEVRNLIKKISKYVPWNGGTVIRNKDVDAIMDAFDGLSETEQEIVCSAIEKIHEIVLFKFQDYCNKATEDQVDWLEQVAVFMVNNPGGTIFDILNYIDLRYRDFADLIGIELPALEIEIEEDEEDDS